MVKETNENKYDSLRPPSRSGAIAQLIVLGFAVVIIGVALGIAMGEILTWLDSVLGVKNE